MRFLLLVILMLFFSRTTYAQKTVKIDTSAIVIRTLDKKALRNFSEEKDFQYINTKEPAKSIWERFWSWVWWKFSQLMSTRSGRAKVWTVVIIIALALIIFFALRVTGYSKQGIFSRSEGGSIPYYNSGDDINNISFDEAISFAINKGNFRLALRLLYLQSLKLLSDKGYIEWQMNKTNSDYVYEVADKPWFRVFKSLTRKFESTWYGEMNIGKEDFEGLQLQFQQFNNQL